MFTAVMMEDLIFHATVFGRIFLYWFKLFKDFQSHTQMSEGLLPSWWCCSDSVTSLPWPTIVATVIFLVARSQCVLSFSSLCWMYSVVSRLGVEMS